MQLMETGTSIQNPGTLVLQYPEMWSPEAQSFLKNTEFATSEELLKVGCIASQFKYIAYINYSHAF